MNYVISRCIIGFAFISFATSTNAQVTVPQVVWIAVRTDNQPGTGSLVDPYDGSTQAKFDAIMSDNSKTPANTTIHLSAGTFRTHAFIAVGGTGFVKPGWTIEGAGMYATTIQAAGPVTGVHSNVHVLESPYNVSADNVTIRDLTVDCNWAELGPTADTGATVRTITDGATTSGSPTVTASSGQFTATDIGNVISGTGIPDNCFIGVVDSSTSVGLSSSPVGYAPVNATANATSVTLTVAQKQVAVDAIHLFGSNILIERCRHINTYGSWANLNEEFGFTIAAPFNTDATGNIIQFCRAESPAGHYGSAFNMSGWVGSPNRYVTNSQIHDCVAIGANTGLPTGFTTGLGGFAHAKDCQYFNNIAIDVQGVFYNDTGSLEGILIANNTLVRGWYGIGVFSYGDPTWTRSNIRIVGNQLYIQNRTVGNGSASYAIPLSGYTFSDLVISANHISFDPNGKGFKQFLTISVGNLVNSTISNNIADEASAGDDLEAPVRGGVDNGSNVTLCLNRTTSGDPMTGLPDNCVPPINPCGDRGCD